MAQYATAAELASYLQKDLDTSSAVQALTLASGDFSAAAETMFAATTATYVTLGTWSTRVELPFNYVTAVSQVRLNGSVITGWTLIAPTHAPAAIYRFSGFGNGVVFPPQKLEVDLTHGLTTAPDDVKLAVLEIAAPIYENSIGAASESIDDYTVRYNGTPIYPGRPWREVAADYRGVPAGAV